MISFDKKDRLTNIVKGISAVLIYFAFSLFGDLPFTLLHIDYTEISTLAKELYNFALEVVMLSIIIMIFSKEFYKAFIDLKKNHWNYFSKYFKFYLLGFFLMIVSNALIQFLGGGISGNESAVRDQFAQAPIYTFISAVFLAPLLEESVFRLSFRSIFKNNFIFIMLSGLVFGSLHLISGVTMNLLPLYLISYCSFGFVFAYMLAKTNNIFVSVGFHTMHNGLLMSLQVALLLLG